MYVYQVSERDSGKNTKSHIVTKVEEFCLEVRICFPFHTSRHWDCKSKVKSVSFRRAGNWAAHYLPKCLPRPQQHPEFKAPVVVWEDNMWRGKSCCFGWHRLVVMMVLAKNNAKGFRPRLAEMRKQAWTPSLVSLWPRQIQPSSFGKPGCWKLGNTTEMRF